MINKEYLNKITAEAAFYREQNKNDFVDSFFKRPAYLTRKYVRHLRMLEYYKKNSIMYLYHYYHYRKLSYKLGYQIPPNTVGWGVKLYHWGYIIINHKAKIGKNAKIYPGVTVGGTPKGVPTIGDNCYLGLGSKILGNIVVGDDVMILPNAVVTKDVPAGSIVAGVPASIIKNKYE